MATFDSYPHGTPSYIELTTHDPGAARSFYGSVFGWGWTETPMDDQGGVYLNATIDGDIVAGVSPAPPQMEGHPPYWGVYLTVDDVDRAAGRVAEAGGSVDAGPFDIADSGRMAVVADPTGARVGLWQPTDAVGSQRASEPGANVWNELVTPDLDRATTFYTEVLGVTWEPMDTPNGMDYRTLMVEGRAVAGAMNPMAEGMPPHWNLYLQVDDVDATVATATEAGGSVLAEPWDVPGIGRMAALADPQGAMFLLMQHAG